MKDLYKKFQTLKEELKRNPLIQLDHFEFEEGLSLANIKMVEEDLNIQLSEEIRSFYQQVSEVKFLWTLKDNSKIKLLHNDEPGNVNGKANILDLYTIFTGLKDTPDTPWKDILWFEENMNEEQRQENKKIRPFDFFDNHSGECIGFIQEDPETISPKLYYRNDQATIVTFDLNIEGYLDLLINSKGFVNFQSAFMYKNSTANEKLKYYLPKIFEGISIKD